MHPIKGTVYTLFEIETHLTLDDMAHLMFDGPNGRELVVQNSHLTKGQLLSVPGFSGTRWRYLHTTREWIPIFKYVGVQPITNFLDIDGDWATPKGFPRKKP
jgi:hypothetical protein